MRSANGDAGDRRRNVLGMLIAGIAVVVAGVQTVYSGSLVQGIDPILLLSVCVLFAFVFFNAAQLQHQQSYWRIVIANRRDIVTVNLLTLVGWVGSMVALRIIEPALVQSIVNGIIPITAILFSIAFRRKTASVLRSDVVAGLGMCALALTQIGLVVAGKSGIGGTATLAMLIGIGCMLANAIANGALSTMNKRLAEAGVTRNQVLAARMYVPLLACVGYVAAVRPPIAPLLNRPLGVMIVVAGMVGVVYLIQAALELAEPVTVTLITSLTPMAVFALQRFDHRIKFAPLTLITTSLGVAFVTWSTFMRLRAARA